MWLVHEKYFGKFDCERVVASAPSFCDAVYICEAFMAWHMERPFSYWITSEGISQDIEDEEIAFYNDTRNMVCGEEFDYHLFLHEHHD